MKYDTGTVAVTNGSAAVVGTGTKWLTNLAANQLFSLAGSSIAYTVASITDDTHLTLAANYAGTTGSGLTYTVIQAFTTNYSIPYPDIGDVQTATIMKRAMMLIDTLFQKLTAQNATTTQLTSAADPINTTYKRAGRSVFNTTTNKPVWAVGTNATDVWKDATGTTAHTPV